MILFLTFFTTPLSDVFFLFFASKPTAVFSFYFDCYSNIAHSISQTVYINFVACLVCKSFFCGNSYGRYSKSGKKNYRCRCAGHPTKTCGGVWRNLVYRQGVSSLKFIQFDEILNIFVDICFIFANKLSQ